jgi:heat shock protein HslJ
MSTVRSTCLAVAALTLVAACGKADGSPEPGAAGAVGAAMADLQDRAFVSNSIVDAADQPLHPGTTVTLAFTDDSVSGSAGCNSLSSRASLSNGHLVVDGLGGTEMGCGGRQFHDAWLTDLLTSRPTVMLDGDRLTITSGGTVVELQDQRSADPDRPLVGTEWTLDAIEDGAGAGATVASLPAGVTSTLRFRDDGGLAVKPGCNRGSARYQVHGDAIAVEPMVLTRMACDGPVMEVESSVVELLGGAVTFTIDGPLLRLTSGSRTLVYRAD